MSSNTIASCIMSRINASTEYQIKAQIEELQGEIDKSDVGGLHIKKTKRKGKSYISFYEYVNHKEIYVKKTTDQIYKLSRKAYIKQYIKILNAKEKEDENEIQREIKKMQNLLSDFEKGDLNLLKVTLTEKQFKWSNGNYNQKIISEKARKYKSTGGVTTRSKSERMIAEILEAYGVPFRYEAKLKIKVVDLVKKLEEELLKTGELRGRLYYRQNGQCCWSVPDRYQWMNGRGSIWKTFDVISGEITIHPDFTILLRDGSLLIWEHEGMAEDFGYRCQASERIFVMRCCGFAYENIIATMESDLKDWAIADKIVQKFILPRI